MKRNEMMLNQQFMIPIHEFFLRMIIITINVNPINGRLKPYLNEDLSFDSIVECS